MSVARGTPIMTGVALILVRAHGLAVTAGFVITPRASVLTDVMSGPDSPAALAMPIVVTPAGVAVLLN